MNWRRATIAVALVAPLVAILGSGLAHDPRDIPSPLPGRAAPEFALEVLPVGESVAPATHGVPDTVRLAALRGQVVVLNFWASWCLACRDEHPALTAAARAYAGRGVRVLGVLYNDRAEAGRRWIADMGGQAYPALVDPRARTAIDYGLYGVPETFFIARDGRVAFKQVGPVTPALLVARLDSLLAEPWDSTALERDARALSARLRCPVCQGESIADSPAPLAAEMRALVREQLAAGRGPKEIERFFVARYGEWILLEPAPRGMNLLVYVLPPLALVLGGLVIATAVRRWIAAAQEVGPPRRPTAGPIPRGDQ